ncbi:hypothetical protein [Actinoallomurus spadix]|uniref:Uncharacterized protein n=2 Tax=Actinoallomurus spadix TaxID=79912 RepID=A0ABN0WKW2_9ACTN
MAFIRRRRPAEEPERHPPARPWDLLQGVHAELAARLEEASSLGLLSDVDHVRIARAVSRAVAEPQWMRYVIDVLRATGGAAFLHPSGQRDLPVRFGRHKLDRKLTRLGVVTDEPRNPAELQGAEFALDQEMLRTSLLAIGPPGSGKTRGFALPIVEHLCLQSLANAASVVVIDPKGDDFAIPGWFDVDIDLANPDGSWGFDLYGGAATPEQAADRLAAALLPPGVSADATYYMDAAKNALYNALAPFHAARDAYPTIRQLLEMLRGEGSTVQSVRSRLKNQGRLKEYEHLLQSRTDQRGRRNDPATGLVERLGLLNRPTLVELLDEKPDKFRMSDINRPLRVRLALPEGMFPEAARILARLAVAQFVQVTSSPSADDAIFKGLVIDEAGRYVDDYVARGLQRVRSRNAGLVLLTQSLGDFPDELRRTVFSSTGCKAVFAGVNPDDAAYYSEFFGTHWVEELTMANTLGETETKGRSGHSTTWGPTGMSTTTHGKTNAEGTSRSIGASARQVERPLWSPGEIINDVPPGHALISLARPDGVRVPATLVNLRA